PRRPRGAPAGRAPPRGAGAPGSAGLPTQAFDPLFDDLPFGPAGRPRPGQEPPRVADLPDGLRQPGRNPAADPTAGPRLADPTRMPGALGAGVPGGPRVGGGAPGTPGADPFAPAPGPYDRGYPAPPPVPPPPVPPPGAPRPPGQAARIGPADPAGIADPGRAPGGRGPAGPTGASPGVAPPYERAPGFQPSTQFPAPPPRPPAVPPPGSDSGLHHSTQWSPLAYPEPEAARGPAQPGPGHAPPGRGGRDPRDMFDVSSAPRPRTRPADNRGDGAPPYPPPPPSAPPPPPSAPRRRNTPAPDAAYPTDRGMPRTGMTDPEGLGRAAGGGRHGTNHPSSALYSDALLPPAQETAARGWRKVVYQVSGGAVNPGPSPDEARYNRLLGHIRTPLVDCHRIAVMSLKGGVGKTTTTIGLGSTLADLRDDRVVAIDANPDRGTLGTKVQLPSQYTVRDLLEDAPRLRRYVDIRQYMARSDSRLDVLASADDPEISEAFADSDYRSVDDLLQRYYSILLTDCGTGMLHSAMGGVLALADTLVIVTSSSADGGTSASATLDWLDAHGFAEQVRDAVAVISMFPQNGDGVDVDTLEAHFAARTRRVVRVPWDPHLATGGRINLHELKRETRRAYQELAAAVAEHFTAPELDSAGYPSAAPYRDDRLFS
ncbi:nucleotide-binding protein, partial [Frankia nepalensis]|uniref:nucleotide-binding protein n=1 Tax=Frankia nepalensis TaxID=1836974 RepID=UPI001EE4B17E